MRKLRHNDVSKLEILYPEKYKVILKERKILVELNNTLENVIINDVRAPLQSVIFSMGKLKLLTKGNANNSETEEIINSVSSILNQVNTYTGDIQISNSIFKDEYKWKKVSLSIGEQIIEAINFYEINFPENEKSINFLSTKQKHITFDKTILNLLLRNSIKNAIYYGNSNVTVQLIDKKKGLCIKVTNSFSKESKKTIQKKIQEIIEPAMIIESNDKYKLGIITMREIAHRLGIEYTVTSKGNKFYVNIFFNENFINHKPK